MQHIANIAGNKKLVLPVPAFNVINGGSHAGNKLAMQACFLRPFFCLSVCVREREIKQDEFHIFVKCYVYAGVYGSSCGSFLVQGSHEDGCRSISQFEGQFLCYIHLHLPKCIF